MLEPLVRRMVGYYWGDHPLTRFVYALGAYADETDALRNGLGRISLNHQPANLNHYVRSPWYPSAFAPDELPEKMRGWNSSFDFCLVSAKDFGGKVGRQVGYLIRTPSQTLDPE